MIQPRFRKALRIVLPLAFGAGATALFAQSVRVDRDGPVAISDSFEVNGIHVDVTADGSEEARQDGWRIAQRKGWAMLSRRLTGKAGSLSDSALNGVVAAVVVDHEEIGPKRYVADLGILFSRERAGRLLGVTTRIARSRPMLLVPLQWSGGVGTAFERNTAWTDAWNRFRTAGSKIDYVRPAGTGPDPLLLNAGQVGRRGRGWWRSTLDQYGATDVLVPQVRLRRQWPGGPIVATFTAGHGPDNQRLTRFSLRVENADGLDALLDEGVKRLDAAYQKALNDGVLRLDPMLAIRPAETDEKPAETTDEAAIETIPDPDAAGAEPNPAAASNTINIQYETPGATTVTTTESALRAIPGVRSAVTSSLALGGMSVMQVRYSGNIDALRAALESRGWQVQAGSGTLRITRTEGGG
ncbi:heavy-metal-associated domain-containing protein [Stakelama saccharophila]|uniref:Heavy-metal-associated domain-containing protein n=1 Tax=Stakelama saccharophila TaxID=3075605 RepID=A0ABZ0B897_9SPHN|nr:heavy-metal-associated domain-containing protein [Stakelama sp. W311]WNO52554.1 heavy-metal-associated domain-containing protein [Stakelama sp. W311]